MKLCKTSRLKENQVLAQPIMAFNYQILLGKGTVLKSEYIEKLKELGITEVYVQEDEEANIEELAILQEETEQALKRKVKDILENHVFQNNQKLEELVETANRIIADILKEPKVIEAVYDIKERSADLYEHSVSVSTYAVILATKLKLDEKASHDIGVACLLHDLGLRYIPLDFSNKEFWNLSESEQVEYRKHPIYGYTILEKEDWISEKSKQIILKHHEHIDGSGFPLKTRDISIECKIVSVCDAFDEMISGIACCRSKVYRAVEYIKSCQDIYFDKEVTESFLEFIAVYPVGSKVLTNQREEAIVIMQNKHFPERPVLKILRTAQGEAPRGERLVDMVKENHIFIDKVLD